MKKQNPLVKKYKNPQTAILSKCLDCSGGSKTEVLNCPITDCPLFTFRCKQIVDQYYSKVTKLTPVKRKGVTSNVRSKKS